MAVLATAASALRAAAAPRAAAAFPPRAAAFGQESKWPAAALVALAALGVATVAELLMLAVVALASDHDALSVGTLATPVTLLGAGFACVDTAAVLAIWRRGRLHPSAVIAIWGLALLVPVPAARAAAAAVAIAGGALALRLGADPVPARASWRAPACLAAVGCVLMALAAGTSAAPASTAPSPAARAETPTPAAPAAPTPAAGAAISAAPAPAAPPAEPAPAASPSAPAAAPTSVAPASAAPSPAAVGIVRDYYAALDAHRFATAWRRLAAPVQRGFGGFSAWRAGYRTTVSSRPRGIRVTAAGAGALLVRHVLVATDRTPCGTRTTRRFAVRWRLVASGSGWRATSLTAVALPGGALAGCG